MKMAFLGVVRPEWLSISVLRKWDCMMEVGTVLGQSMARHGTVLHNPKIYFGLKLSMCGCRRVMAWKQQHVLCVKNENW